MNIPKLIAVDFDGTCVHHQYPAMGPDVPYAASVLKALASRGSKFILWTVRGGSELDAALAWFEARGIEIWSANCNPWQASWSASPKAYAEVYIDDSALGCPLTYHLLERPTVDWLAVAMYFQIPLAELDE